MLRQGLIIGLGIAFGTLLIFGFKSELRKMYFLNDDFYWNIDIVNEKAAYEKAYKSQQWERWELGLLTLAAGVAIAAISWSVYTVLQTLEGKRIEKKTNKPEYEFLRVAERVTKVEQCIADLITNMSRLSDSLDKLASTPVEMLYARDNGDRSLLTNDESVSSHNLLNPEGNSTPKIEDITDAVNEDCLNSSRSTEPSPPPSRPDTPRIDPFSWYQESETFNTHQTDESNVEQPPKLSSYEYEKSVVASTEVTVSEPLCLPVGCGEAGRGQAKRIPQYQGNRRNLRSRGKESTVPENSPRKEQTVLGDSLNPRRKRGCNQKF